MSLSRYSMEKFKFVVSENLLKMILLKKVSVFFCFLGGSNFYFGQFFYEERRLCCLHFDYNHLPGHSSRDTDGATLDTIASKKFHWQSGLSLIFNHRRHQTCLIKRQIWTISSLAFSRIYIINLAVQHNYTTMKAPYRYHIYEY